MKCIIIEDSFKKYYGTFDKKSRVITCRNPFKKDESIIDYDMDSEDEWNEENGEDLDKEDENEQNEEEDANSEDQEAGFIVSDGHLSVSEYNFSDEGEETIKKAEIEQRR